MRKLVLILITFLLVVSCQEKQLVDKPDHFIEEGEMTAILVDYYLAKGYNDDAKKGKRIQKSEDEAINPSAYIYKKHSIDSLQFAQNMNYYLTQKETVMAIFTNAEDELKALKKQYEDKKIVADSLKRIKNAKKKKKLKKSINEDLPKVIKEQRSKVELEKEHQLRTEKPKINLSDKP